MINKINILLNKILMLLLLSAVVSCGPSSKKVLFERPDHAFDEDLKEASLEFKQGWQDGCETGMSSGSNTFYKMFYESRKIDGYKAASSSDYSAAWTNAYWYCYRYDYIKQKSSIWGSMFSGVL